MLQKLAELYAKNPAARTIGIRIAFWLFENWSTFRAWVSPQAFEQRERDSERKKLVRDLENIDAMRKYCDEREPVIIARLNALSREDLQLEKIDNVSHMATYRTLTDTTYISLVERSANKIDGEYIKTPRTMTEAFGGPNAYDNFFANEFKGATVRLIAILVAFTFLISLILWLHR